MGLSYLCLCIYPLGFLHGWMFGYLVCRRFGNHKSGALFSASTRSGFFYSLATREGPLEGHTAAGFTECRRQQRGWLFPPPWF